MRHFFDVPIYRLDINSYLGKREEDRKRYLDRLKRTQPRPATPNDLRTRVDRYLAGRWPPSWWYNEIVGWISLSVEWDRIRGDLWGVTSAQPRRGSKKEFKLHHPHCISLRPSLKNSNTEISDLIMQELRKVQKRPGFEKRYFYLDEFDNIRGFIDWRGLMAAGHK